MSLTLVPAPDMDVAAATVAASDSNLRLVPAPASWAGLGHADTDRRRAPRLTVEQTVKLFDATSNRYFAGHTRDMSDTGFQLEMPAKVPARAGETALVYVSGAHAGRGFVEQASLVPVRYIWVRRTPATAGDPTPRCVCGVQVLADVGEARNAA